MGKATGIRMALKAGGKGDVTQTSLVWESKLPDLGYVPCMLTSERPPVLPVDKGFAGCLDAKTASGTGTNGLGGDFTASAGPDRRQGLRGQRKRHRLRVRADPTFKLLARSRGYGSAPQGGETTGCSSRGRAICSASASLA